MRRILGTLLLALALLTGGLLTAAPSQAATSQSSIFCGGYTIWQKTVSSRYYDGGGQLRARVDSVSINVTAPSGHSIQEEHRIRLISTTGTGWDTGYTVTGFFTTPGLAAAYAPGSGANALVSRSPYVLIEAGVYNDGNAACSFGPIYI